MNNFDWAVKETAKKCGPPPYIAEWGQKKLELGDVLRDCEGGMHVWAGGYWLPPLKDEQLQAVNTWNVKR